MTLPPHQYYLSDGSIAEYSADYLRELKLTEVNNWRDIQLAQPVEYSGYMFDFDQSSQFRVLAVVISGAGSPTGFWTTADNIDVASNHEFMLGLYTAMVTKFSEVHAAQRNMKSELIVMQNNADIAAYGVPQ